MSVEAGSQAGMIAPDETTIAFLEARRPLAGHALWARAARDWLALRSDAGFDWRDSGCSMCVRSNGDTVPAGKRCASTSPRNFEGRQGPGARTHVMSPAMAAAAAVTGKITDVRTLLGAA